MVESDVVVRLGLGERAPGLIEWERRCLSENCSTALSNILRKILNRCHGGLKNGVLTTAVLFLVAFLVTSAVRAGEGGACSVLKDSSGFVDHAKEAGSRLTSRFFKNLREGATGDEIRGHLANENIFAHFVVGKLASVESSCRFESSVDSTYVMNFNFVGTNSVPLNECFLSHCAQLLAGIVRSGPPPEPEFQSVVSSIAAAMEHANAEQSSFLSLGLRRATLEVYRQLYADGTPEKIIVSLDGRDFRNSSYGNFLSWYRRFSDQPAGTPSASDANVGVVSRQHICKVRAAPMIRELNIDRRGWGQRAILLVDQGYSSDGAEGIPNAMLRDLCPPHAVADRKAPNVLPDRLANSISCAREDLGSDRWLVIYSNRQPVANLQEMKAIAASIATALGGETCSDERARIYIANFTGQEAK
jgi:hypothetical protein